MLALRSFGILKRCEWAILGHGHHGSYWRGYMSFEALVTSSQAQTSKGVSFQLPSLNSST